MALPNARTVIPPSEGGVITGMNLSVGEAVPALASLAEINGVSVCGIPSAQPFYRNPVDGDSGADVAAPAALNAAGFDCTPDGLGVFGTATLDALESWQVNTGLAETGEATLDAWSGSSATISQIRVEARAGDVNTFGSAVEADMRTAHNLGPTQADDFLVINPTTVVAADKASSTDLTRLITAIAATSLVVGGIGIANVMLVAVRERTREIRLRRALGARRRDVLVQFVTNATMLSAVGGAIKVAAGLGLAYLLPPISSQQTSVSYFAAALAFVGSAVVGIVAVGPANQAASLEPASALHYE